MTVIAAEALRVPRSRVRVEIGDSRLPPAWFAGASCGTASWGTAVDRVCRKLRVELDVRELVRQKPGLKLKASFAGEELEVSDEAGAALEAFFDAAEKAQEALHLGPFRGWSFHAFGAQFVEVRVDVDTGEVRVPRMVGVFAAGRIINAPTARSQLAGGMIMGLSMALHEGGVMDSRFGDYVNHDLASYHFASCADVGDIDVSWVDERDPHVNPIGVKGVGELGIVGTAAAIANAVHHATGIRVRDLPIHVEKLVEHLSPVRGSRNGQRRIETSAAAWAGAGSDHTNGSPRGSGN
jgi:xanthine dehydrogenase YagR molybdenum-binding subunit